MLKHLGYNKYYEHISYIKDKLGIRPPHMSSHLEDTLCNLFLEIQIPYAKYCPNNRVNFLNYYNQKSPHLRKREGQQQKDLLSHLLMQ